jgi:hypothetical protein
LSPKRQDINDILPKYSPIAVTTTLPAAGPLLGEKPKTLASKSLYRKYADSYSQGSTGEHNMDNVTFPLEFGGEEQIKLTFDSRLARTLE